MLISAVTLNENSQIVIVPSPQVFKVQKCVVLNFYEMLILNME